MIEKITHEKCAKKSGKHHHGHPNHSESLPRLKKVQGQLDGIANMINEKRYCPDIIIQIKAAISALKSIEGQVIERHLRGCIHGAIKNKNAEDINKKIEELINLYMKGL